MIALTFAQSGQSRPMRPANHVYFLAPEREFRSIVACPTANAIHFAMPPFYPDRLHRPYIYVCADRENEILEMNALKEK